MTDKTPQAFPMPVGHSPTTNAIYNRAHKGMTLRDYFAAKIAAAVMGSHSVSAYSTNPESVAARAYQIADALMEARSK